MGKAGTASEIDPIDVGDAKGNNPALGGDKYAAFILHNLDTITHDIELTYLADGSVGGTMFYLNGVFEKVDSLD